MSSLRHVVGWSECLITWLVSLLFSHKFDREKYHFNIPEVWYSPWAKDEAFNQIYSTVASNTLVTKRKLYDLYCISKQMNVLNGNYLEVGTLRGGAAAMLASTFSGENLILWDNWGKPVEQDKYFVEKKYSEDTDLIDTRDLMAKVSPEVLAKSVFVNDLFPDLEVIKAWNAKFTLVHFDIYDSTAFVEGVGLLWPKIQIGGVFVVSAYGSISLDSLTMSVNEFVKKQRNCLFVQSQSGMGLLIKKYD